MELAIALSELYLNTSEFFSRRQFPAATRILIVPDSSFLSERMLSRTRTFVASDWKWQGPREQDLLETLPRFPPSRERRDVAGRHYLTKSEINALYFATYQLKRPRGWADSFSIGRYLDLGRTPFPFGWLAKIF